MTDNYINQLRCSSSSTAGTSRSFAYDKIWTESYFNETHLEISEVVISMDIPSPFVICINNAGSEDLIVGKVYRLLHDDQQGTPSLP